MSCEILWSPATLNRRFNNYYPFLVSTPNGQTIKAIRLMNMEKDEDTGQLMEIAADRMDQPSLVVYRHNDSMNIKSYILKPNETKYYLPIYGAPTSGRSTSLVSPGNINEPIKVNKLIRELDSDEEGRLFSSFILMTARVQQPAAKYLYQAGVEITMSDGTVLLQILKYISPTKTVQDKQKAALYKALYIFYHNITNKNLSDDDIMNNIIGRIPEFWPDLSQTIKKSTRKAASNGTYRRIELNANRKKRKRVSEAYNEEDELKSDSGVSDEDSDDEVGDVVDSDDEVEPPAKRHNSHTDAIIMSNIVWMDVDQGIFYIIVKDIDISGDEWVIDNVETRPVVDGRVEVLKQPPQILMNDPDMYKTVSYRTIIENARQRAKTDGDTLLWLKVTDTADLLGPSEPTTITFTARETTGDKFINVTTNGFEGTGLELFSSKLVIKTLYEYYNGTTTPASLMGPPSVEAGDEDFIHFQRPGEFVMDIDFDTDIVPPSIPLSPLPLSPIDLEPIDDF